ncbi:hypothetical protein EFO20_08990 [Lactococcus lactis]|nr:hypothetical protein [Lactococcus lactis subsp. lactis]MCT3106977.1 hypothetical protein [Lactococcus lactis]MCT3113806.1 hypothetical protein [Lactococcus lactis]
MFRNSTITDLFLFVFTQLILHYLFYAICLLYIIINCYKKTYVLHTFFSFFNKKISIAINKYIKNTMYHIVFFFDYFFIFLE